MRTAARARRGIVGRESELAVLRELLGAGGEARALLLTGGPGIGKTTLWQAGVTTALERAAVVLRARPSEAEAQLSHAALADVFEGIDPEVLSALPEPQRTALEVAFLRAEPAAHRPEAHAVAAGVLRALRELSRRSPVLVAVDDVQWLDGSSANALAFAARRLQDEAVAFLLTERAGLASPLTSSLEPRLHRLEIGGLSLGATRRLLVDRLAFSPSRRVLRRIHDATRGNPLFALEVGRMLGEGVPPTGDDEIPVPDRLEDLLGIRVDRLPGGVQKALLGVALSGGLRLDQLEAVVGRSDVDTGLDGGLLVLDGGRVRAAHPLLAAAARTRSPARERREMHLALAGEAEDLELRVRHLALATTGPSEELASLLAEASSGAAARGAADGALELATSALRLTPPDSEARPDRVLAVGELLLVTGEQERLNDLIEVEQDRLPSGAPRARAHLLRAVNRFPTAHADEFSHHLDRALAESADDPALGATVTALRVRQHAVARVERIREAESWAVEALPAARAAGAAVERDVLQALAWVRVLRGKPVDDIRRRFDAASTDAFELFRSPERAVAERMALRGEVDPARDRLKSLLVRADERGEMHSYAMLRLQLVEVELRAGRWEAAERHLDVWDRSPEGRLIEEPTHQRCEALLAGGRGHASAAELAETAIEAHEARGWVWGLFEARRARGLAALLAHDATRAAENLWAVWEHTEREGVEEPAMFPVAPDLVEALVELDQLDEAEAVTARLQYLATEQEHPWGLATAQRCRGVLELARGIDLDRALTDLEGSALAFDELELVFDRARVLLLLGRGARRHKKWGVARSALERAGAAFEEIGSAGWAEQARSELARVGGRRPKGPGRLTAAEERVVELAREGLSNKEIAAQLVVSVHTVEVHLTHAYEKLGIHSRGQLRRSSTARE